MCYLCKNKNIIAICPKCNNKYCINCFTTKCYVKNSDDKTYIIYDCDCDTTFGIDIKLIDEKYYINILRNTANCLSFRIIQSQINDMKKNITNDLRTIFNDILITYKAKKRKTIRLKELEEILNDIILKSNEND